MEGESADKPGSVLDRSLVTVIHLRHMSPYACSNLPGSQRGPRFAAEQHTSLFGLAPGGVYRAAGVSLRGALLPHHFTLTAVHPLDRERPIRSTVAVYFLWHFP
jgi:hypothetical protein